MHKLKSLLNMIAITVSKKYAMSVASNYWKNTTKTHGSMEEKQFDFYYKELEKIISPKKEMKIVDYGGGNGEIAYRFQQNSYSISHCDINQEMIQNSIEKYHLKSCHCDDIKGEYDVILFHNAFFYIHPSVQRSFLKKMFSLLNEGGKLYITDTPDFDKRALVVGKLHYLLSYLFPVYQIPLAGFFIQDKKIQKIAKEVGFAKVEKLDSWADYRTHWILEKGKNDK